MRQDDVFGQFVRRKFGWILLRSGRCHRFCFQLLGHTLGRNSFLRARLAQSATALAAEIDAARLKNARASGPFRHELADRAVH
jgi:hypothetical protein